MLKLPNIDTKVKIINGQLKPYFHRIETEIRLLSFNKQKNRLQKYKIYIEKQARKTDSRCLRMQLRINLQSLLEKFDIIKVGNRVPNVYPSSNKLRGMFTSGIRPLVHEEYSWMVIK